jgi:hypothetical protein
MNNRLTAKERAHLGRVKELQCSVCDAPGPSEAHHVKQGQQYTAVALCESCHRGALMGWHGQRRAWAIRKMDELSALNKTIERLCR